DVFKRTHRTRRCEPRRNAALCVVERQRSLRMSFSVTVFLIQNEILHTQNAQLVQSSFLLLGIGTFGAFRFRAGDDFFEICRNYETRTFLINLCDAIVKRRRRETACASVCDCRDTLKLLQLRTGGKKIRLNPNVKLLSLVVSAGRRCGCRILNKLDFRSAFLVARVLCDLLLEELAEALRVLQFSKD